MCYTHFIFMEKGKCLLTTSLFSSSTYQMQLCKMAFSTIHYYSIYCLQNLFCSTSKSIYNLFSLKISLNSIFISNFLLFIFFCSWFIYFQLFFVFGLFIFNFFFGLFCFQFFLFSVYLFSIFIQKNKNWFFLGKSKISSQLKRFIFENFFCFEKLVLF